MASYRLNLRNAVFTQAQSSLSAYPVQYPNQKGFVTPNNSTWIKLFLLFPNETFRQALTVRDRIDFILQVDCLLPKGSGDIEVYNIADSLDSTFPIDGTPLTYNGQEVYVKYISTPRPLPIGGEKDDAWERYVIRIGMYAFVDRS